MNELPTWLRPRRWLAFFLTLLGVCSFLAIVPVSHQSAEPAVAALDAAAKPNPTFIDDLRDGAREVQVTGHWTSLLPPLLAIMVAAFFRTIVGALVSAFAVGSFLSYGLNPLATAVLGVNDFLIRPAFSQFSVLIILFLVALVGMVGVMAKSGGLDGLVTLMERFAKGRRRAKVAIGLSGLLLFFDDYANSVVVGSTMRRLSDRWKISREKLAYLVDSTAAPVAGLALLSTWVAFEVFLLGGIAAEQGLEISGYGLLVEMLPLRFYCIGTLVFVFMSAASGRDFGPMLSAERRAYHEGKVIDDAHKLMVPRAEECDSGAAPPRWANALAPLLVLLLGIVMGIAILGHGRLLEAGAVNALSDFEGWRDAFAAAVYDPNEGSYAGVMAALLAAALLLPPASASL